MVRRAGESNSTVHPFSADAPAYTARPEAPQPRTAGAPRTPAAASPREQSALKTLILPGEMGERFKVLLLRKNATGPPLPGRDFRARLA